MFNLARKMKRENCNRIDLKNWERALELLDWQNNNRNNKRNNNNSNKNNDKNNNKINNNNKSNDNNGNNSNNAQTLKCAT